VPSLGPDGALFSDALQLRWPLQMVPGRWQACHRRHAVSPLCGWGDFRVCNSCFSFPCDPESGWITFSSVILGHQQALKRGSSSFVVSCRLLLNRIANQREPHLEHAALHSFHVFMHSRERIAGSKCEEPAPEAAMPLSAGHLHMKRATMQLFMGAQFKRIRVWGEDVAEQLPPKRSSSD
jgi:hypothetical protein